MRVIHESTIYQLTFMPRVFPVNCYFVEEEESLTLIDAALPFCYKGIIKAANKIGKPISRIAITHAHEDHMGAIDELKAAYPNAIVYVSKRDSRIINGNLSLDKEEPNMPIKGGVPKKLKTRADILLNDGDKVGSLIAIATPVHTPGSISYFDTRSKAIIVGDVMQTRGGIAVAGQLMPLFPFPAMATWNKELALDSAKKLIHFEPELLATGHGKMLINPVETMKRVFTEYEAKINKSL